MRRITVVGLQSWIASDARCLSGHADPAWYIDRLERASSRWEAESRLLQALDDPDLSDDNYHAVRVHFDHVAAKGWPA